MEMNIKNIYVYNIEGIANPVIVKLCTAKEDEWMGSMIIKWPSELHTSVAFCNFVTGR